MMLLLPLCARGLKRARRRWLQREACTLRPHDPATDASDSIRPSSEHPGERRAMLDGEQRFLVSWGRAN